jgi:hypothetical protein
MAASAASGIPSAPERGGTAWVLVPRTVLTVVALTGGLLFTTIVAAWYSSALWFFQLVGEGL